MAEETITLKLIAQDLASGNISKAISGLDKLAKQGGIVGGVFQGIGQSIGLSLNPLALGAKAFHEIADAISGAASAAIADEASIAKLTTAISQNEATWDGNIAKIEEVIRARMALGFEDDAQRDSLAQLMAQTKDLNEALRLQRVAMDLSRLRNIDLTTASTLLGKVYGGNIGILSRYGIQLEEGTTATEALAEVQKRAAGQAEAYGESVGGKVLEAQIQLGEASEVLGTALLPVVAGLADFAADVIPGLISGINDVGEAFHNLERLMSPHLALIEDTESAIRAQAAARGLSVEAAVSAFRAEQQQVQTQERLLQLEEEIARAKAEAPGQLDSLVKERDALLNASEATDTYAESVDFGAQATADAVAFLEKNVASIPEATAAMSASLSDLETDATESVTGITTQVGTLSPSIVSAIEGATGPVQGAMAALLASMQEPFISAPYRTFLATQQRQANALLIMAIREGKVSAAREAALMRDAILAELRGLANQSFDIRIPVSYTSTGAPRPGGWDGNPATPWPMAKGGIVTGPTVALMGERGPEAVIPLDRAGGLGDTYNINIGYVRDARSFAQEVGPELERWRRRVA